MSRIATVICTAVAVAAGGYWLTLSNSTAPNPLVSSAEAQEADLDTSTVVEMVQGDKDAPVEIIEYASYTCPHSISHFPSTFQGLITQPAVYLLWNSFKVTHVILRNLFMDTSFGFRVI